MKALMFDSVFAQASFQFCGHNIPLTKAIARAMGLPEAKELMLGVTPPTHFGDPQSNRILMVGQLRHGQGTAVERICGNYEVYQVGLRAFAEHFDCDQHYDSFGFLD